MRVQKRRPTVFHRSIAVLSPPLFPLLLIASSATAQDLGHVRVPFARGAAWTQTAPGVSAYAPLPQGPAQAINQSFARSAESGPPQGRLRLKNANFDGM